MAWVIGRDKGLKPGAAYLLEVEYPDDVPRSLFVANRGADLVRGFATGSAAGDCRQQYVQPSIESLEYPQTGRWQRHRTIFFLHDRFQGLYAQRDSRPGGRPFGPADGFHVLIFQSKRLNDPRSQGAAIGRIRLRAVPDVPGSDSQIELPPDDLPRRRVFWREEMADEAVQARWMSTTAAWPIRSTGSCSRPGWRVCWRSTRLPRTCWSSASIRDGRAATRTGSTMPSRRITDLWDRAVPRIAAEGLDLLPYYEYKGAIGLKEARPQSLGWQRRAEKLYHNQPEHAVHAGLVDRGP